MPQRLQGVRFLLYGYNTALLKSASFQRTHDIAISLVNSMKTIGCSGPTSKPIIFLAHSLGGVVLKQAMVNLAEGWTKDHAILEKIRGAVFFGVPSQGMDIPDLMKMVGSQPNEAFLDELSSRSEFLSSLDQHFGRITDLWNLSFFWAYETKVTPTVQVRLISMVCCRLLG